MLPSLRLGLTDIETRIQYPTNKSMHKFTRRGSAVGTELAHFGAGSFARRTVREILLSSGRRVRRWMPECASLRVTFGTIAASDDSKCVCRFGRWAHPQT